MTEEQFDILKHELIDNVKKFVTENGGIPSHLTVFAENKNKNDYALIHIAIPEEMMMDDEGKDKFVNDLFPEAAKEIKKSFSPVAIAWIAEAWVRTFSKDKNPNFELNGENWKDLPIEKEVIIITIESNKDKECVVYDIIRDGKIVNNNGELVDKIELVETKNLGHPDGFGGRFSGLFNKLKD